MGKLSEINFRVPNTKELFFFNLQYAEIKQFCRQYRKQLKILKTFGRLGIIINNKHLLSI